MGDAMETFQAVVATALAAARSMSAIVERLQIAPGGHRIPPHSVEAELAVISSILAGSDYRPAESQAALLDAQERVNAQHFYIPANRMMWETLVSMEEQKKPLGLLALTQELRDRNLLDSVGGVGYVTDVSSFVPTAANISYYLDVMREKHALRQIITLGQEAVRRAYEEQSDAPALIEDVQADFTAVSLSKLEDSPLKHIKDEVGRVLDEIENAFKHRGSVQGLATPFVDLDRRTNGMMEGDMVVVAARPSMGKTAFAMNVAEYVASRRETPSRGKNKPPRVYPGYPVAIFSCETSRYRMVRRMLCGRARINLQRLRDGFLKHGKEGGLDQAAILEHATALTAAPIYIDETPALRITDFKARARWAVAKLKARLIVIDYVQLMTVGGKPAESSYERAIELRRISQTIKNTARELNIPIMAVAQLNREAEKSRSGKPSRPRMSHLGECGAFEQDADHIWLLWRPEYYEDDPEKKKKLEGEAEVIIAKNKDGPTKRVKLTFLKEYTHFENRAREDGSMPRLYDPDEESQEEGYHEEPEETDEG
jgi:replicative DNA helicase